MHVDYALRAAVRRALHTAGFSLGILPRDPSAPLAASAATGPGPRQPADPLFLLAALDPPLEQGLQRLFHRLTAPDPIALWRANGSRGPMPTLNRVKERLRCALSPVQFAASLSALLPQALHAEDLASLVANLRLDELGRVNFVRFVQFVALPLSAAYTEEGLAAAEAAAAVPPPGAGGRRGGGGEEGEEGEREEEGDHWQAQPPSSPQRDPFIVYSGEGAPRPISSPLSPTKRKPVVKPSASAARTSPSKSALHALSASAAASASASPWDTLDLRTQPSTPFGSTSTSGSASGSGVRKPKVTVAWPCDLSQPGTAFWAGVGALEAAVMREVRRRALVTGSMPQESAQVASAGANVTVESEADGAEGGELAGGSRREVDALLGPRTDQSGVFQNMTNLKRAFLFFDRQGRHCVTVEDLHATLAELGQVDAPVSAARGEGGGLGGEEEEAVGVSAPPRGAGGEEGEAPGAAEAGSVAVGPSRLKFHRPAAAAAAAAAKAARAAVQLKPAPVASYTQRSAADALAMEDAWEVEAMASSSSSSSSASSSGSSALGHTHTGSLAAAGGSTSTLPFGLPEPPCWDPLASSLSSGARALVLAVYRRMLGESDPGLAGAPVRGFSLQPLRGQPPLPELTYTHFVGWAAPLGRKLKRMRERIQGAFLASATTGGGGKDLRAAFRKVDANGDGVLSVAEFIKAIGPLAGELSPLHLQELVDAFDKDASGTVDFKEFLQLLVQH